MPKKPPHCANAWHFQPCICTHERQAHTDEKGVCKERSCDCLQFVLPARYPELEHVTMR